MLDNATFRLLGVSPAWTRYLVLNFRISAVSDEKRDFMLRLGFNLATGALADEVLSRVVAGIDHSDAGGQEPEANIPDDPTLPEMWDRARLLALVGRALQPRVTEALAPFVKGLRRRLGRDQDRLHHYHNDLHREAMTRALALPTGDKRREREELRAQAILREYHAKLDDLSRQYATKVTVEWSQTLELVMRVHRFAVQIRRRKAERTVQLDWNPLARRLESPPCDYSASTERPRLVCDEALHLVAPSGLSPCQGCGKVFCRACHCERCPKCGAGEISSTGRLGILEFVTSTTSQTNRPWRLRCWCGFACCMRSRPRSAAHPAEHRRAVRQERSRPIVDALHGWLQDQVKRVSGPSDLAKAMRYAIRHWPGLVVFLDDGRVEMDTNVVERAIRPNTLTRKNALFAGSDGGAKHWALAMTLIQTAKLNGVDPLAWLTDVLERIVSGRTKAHEMHTLLPWTWAATNASSETEQLAA